MKAWVDGECTLCFLSWEHLDAEKRVVRCNITVMVHTFMHQSNFHTGYKIVHFYWSRSSDSDAYIHLLVRPRGDHTGRFQDVVAEQLTHLFMPTADLNKFFADSKDIRDTNGLKNFWKEYKTQRTVNDSSFIGMEIE